MKLIFAQKKPSTTSFEGDIKGILRAGQSGQVVIEYVLLLVVGIAIAALITTQMVSRSADSPGFLVAKWREILTLVGGDTADDLKQEP